MSRKLVLAPLLALFVTWFILLRPSSLGGPASYVIVSGVSMEPTLFTGDLVVVRKQTSYSVGDIVAFRVKDETGGDVGNVIHRIVGGTADEGFIMQGDNKNGSDPWRPKPGEILGKLWFYVPGGGNVFTYLRHPQRLTALVGILATVSLLGGAEASKRLKRGGRMAITVKPETKKTSLWIPVPVSALAVAGGLTVLAIAFVVGTVLAFRQPTHQEQTVERVRFEHVGRFDYVVQAQRSTLYPDGIVGPVKPVSGNSSLAPPQPIYTQLARSLDLGFTYELAAPNAADVAGEISAALQIQAADGWTKTEQVVPPTPFSGPTASTRVDVDFDKVFSVITAIENETGVKSASYTVTVIPSVHLRGRVGDEPVDEWYTPRFGIALDHTRITPNAELVQREPRKYTDTVRRDAQVGVAGVTGTVTTARLVGVLGSVVTIAALAVVGALLFVRLSRDEATMIQTRYGALLVSVAHANGTHNGHRVEVASMRDLARLAQQDGQIVFHHQLDSGAHVYYVQHGGVTYSYTVVGDRPSRPEV